MPPVIRGLILVAFVALGALSSPPKARGDRAGAAPSLPAGPGMVPFGHAVAPRSAVIVAPRQRVVIVPQGRVVIVPEQHGVMRHEHDMMAYGHTVVVVPGTVLVV